MNNLFARLLAIALIVSMNALSLPFVAPPPRLAEAASPQTIGYDGYLTDSSDEPENGSYDFRVRVYDALAAGTLMFAEEHANVTVTNGYFSIPIGNGTTYLGGSYATVADLPFDTQYYTSLEVTDLATGEMSPRIPINAVAYAYNSYGIIAQSAQPSNPNQGSAVFGHRRQHCLFVRYI
jgi:hypothetical protein